MPSHAEAAAAELRQALTADGTMAAPPWDELIQLVRELVMTWLMVCYPTPFAAYEYLTKSEWSLWERLIGSERRRDRLIRRAVRRSWKGDPASLPAVEAAVLATIQGRLTLTMLRGLYGER